MMEELLAAVLRVEAKLDVLIKALGEDEDEESQMDLEGRPIGGAREPGQPL